MQQPQTETLQQQQQQQQTPPVEPQPTHNHAPTQGTTAEHHPPSYEQAKASAAGQPPAAMAPGQGPVSTTVVPLNQLSDMPQMIDCPFCHKRTQTIVRKEGGNMQMYAPQ